jgi:hypothetical protein
MISPQNRLRQPAVPCHGNGPAHGIAGADKADQLRAAVQSILKPLLPALLLAADIAARLSQALQLIAGRTCSHRPGIIKSKPKVMRPKPHKSMTQKHADGGCC